MKTAPIFVSCGTGKTGRRIVQRLVAAGYPVRVGSRSGTPPFDWFAPETWAEALAGVKTAYVCFYPDLAIEEAPGLITHFTNVAREAGVEKLVLLSGRGESNALRCERLVVESGLVVVRLRASWFFQNFGEGQLLPAVLDGAIVLPAGAAREPFIDVEDIADVAFAALTDSRHDGQLYELTGPRLLGFEAAAVELSEASGRTVSYVPVGFEEFRAAFTPIAGAETANFLTELCREVFDGRNESVADGVERALGRPPRDFRDYCRETAKTGVWAS